MGFVMTLIHAPTRTHHRWKYFPQKHLEHLKSLCDWTWSDSDSQTRWRPDLFVYKSKSRRSLSPDSNLKILSMNRFLGQVGISGRSRTSCRMLSHINLIRCRLPIGELSRGDTITTILPLRNRNIDMVSHPWSLWVVSTLRYTEEFKTWSP